MRRLIPCLLVGLFALQTPLPAHAQHSNARRPTPARPPRKIAPAPTPEAAKAPLLTRYWLLTDSTERVESAGVFSQYINHFVQYPPTALQVGIMATIHALISVLPDGRVGSIAVTRRDLAEAPEAAAKNELATAKAVQELDAELQRVVWQLRFKPATIQEDSTGVRADTVTISHRFAPLEKSAAKE